MAYTKTVWVDNSAPAINATNLNNIENGVEANDAQITINTADIATNTADIATNTADIAALQAGSGNWVSKAVGDNGTSVVAADKVFVDTTGGTFNLVLPASPNNGDTVKFVDAKGNFATATFTIAVPAGVNLMGTLNGTLDLVANYDFVDMTYYAADDNWIITSKP